jgi:DNA-binding MarR family transcriptional regulator
MSDPHDASPPPSGHLDEDLDELPRRILRSWVVWKSALEANYAAVELDGTAPVGAGLVLFALLDRDGWTIGELAARSRVTHVAVLHLVQKLEAAALVTRKPCEADGRVTRVWLTPQGRALEPKMRALHLRNLATLTSILGKKDATRLGALLGRLIDGLSADPVPARAAAAESPKILRAKP